MSFLLSRNAAKCTLGSPSAKAVLRCLCDYADDDGTNCRPSTETISLETELDRRTVFKAVSFLSSNEWLKVFNAGRGSRNFYALNVQKINNGFEQAKVIKEVFKSESGIKFDTSNENATSDKNVSGVVTFLQESGSKNDTQLYQGYTNTKSNIDARSEPVEDELPLVEVSEVVETAPASSKPKTEEKTQSRGVASKTQTSVAKPDDVSNELWADFLNHRKQKKAPVTNRVLVLLRNEAKKAGWTLEAVINRIILRDWTGFEALWVKDEWIERLPGTGDKPIMVKREDFMRDQFVASDLSMFTPEAADLIQSVGVKNTRPFKDRLKPLKNVHGEENVSNPSEASSEDLSTDRDAFNDIPDDFKEGWER